MNSKIIFIHINKCGGTSVKHVLKNTNVFIPKNDDIINIIDSDFWNESIKFTIVRNPYDRIKSLHGMLIRDNYNITMDELLNIIEDESINYKYINKKFPSGEGYIKRHGLPMSHKHYGIINNGKITMDYIFKLENIKTDWEKIKQLTNVKSELVVKNVSNSSEIELLQNHIDIINKYYHEDFMFFGYEKL